MSPCYLHLTLIVAQITLRFEILESLIANHFHHPDGQGDDVYTLSGYGSSRNLASYERLSLQAWWQQWITQQT